MNGGQIWSPDANTELLLHMYGEDAGVTFTDTGTNTHTVTANGNVQTDTDEFYLVASSGLFDGTGDYLSVSDDHGVSDYWDFGSGNFTIDFWIYPTNTAATQCIIGQKTDNSNGWSVLMDVTPNNRIKFRQYGAAAATILVDQSAGLGPATDTWSHVAIIRGWGGNANDYAITINGSVVKTATDSSDMEDFSGDLQIGSCRKFGWAADGTFTGNIDELRVSVGAARWTAAFDPPEIEYPYADESGTAHEVVTTYTETDLDDLKFAQSADTLFIVHPDYVVRQITRTAHDSWTIANTSFTAAPAQWGAAGCNNGYPQSIAFHQDRLVFGGCPGLPDRLWFSKTADYTNMTTGTADDEAMTINLLSGRIDAIRWLSSKRKLLAGTVGGEWWLGGGGEMGVITPTSKQALQDTTYGSIDLQPITLGDTLIYVQEPGHKVRELSYDWQKDSYGGNDLTVLSEHLLKDNTITEMAVQKTPYTTAWMVRDNGDLLALTYMKEHKVVAWSVHTTTGDFESVATIPGSPEDEVWVIVRRDINGSSVRYVERLDTFFNSTSLADAFFVDSGLSYEGAAATAISGLDHLEGEAVQVLADGLVITGHTVSSGAITLASAASEVHVGIGYNSDIETLGVEIPTTFYSKNLSVNRRKDIVSISLRLEDSAGGDYGTDSSNLYTIIPSTALYTDVKEDLSFIMGPALEATVFIRQNEPLPFRINALLMEVEVSN
jgi:hypothetical protein